MVAREILHRMVHGSWGFSLVRTKYYFTKIRRAQFSYKKIVIFSVLFQEILNELFSSSNSTEILVRSFYGQKFYHNRVNFRKSYRVNGWTHCPVLECSHLLSTEKRFSTLEINQSNKYSFQQVQVYLFSGEYFIKKRNNLFIVFAQLILEVLCTLKKGIFLNHPKRFGRCQQTFKWVDMSKETITKSTETKKVRSLGTATKPSPRNLSIFCAKPRKLS